MEVKADKGCEISVVEGTGVPLTIEAFKKPPTKEVIMFVFAWTNVAIVLVHGLLACSVMMFNDNTRLAMHTLPMVGISMTCVFASFWAKEAKFISLSTFILIVNFITALRIEV